MLRSGEQYLNTLQNDRVVILDGQRVQDIGHHPAFAGHVAEVAAWYDARAEGEHPSVTVGQDGDRIGRSFLPPRHAEELRLLRAALEHEARRSGGLLARGPDYVPLVLTGLCTATPYLRRGDLAWAERLTRYARHCASQDLFLSHSYADRQLNRAAGSGEQPHLHAHVGEGGELTVRGVKAVATCGPVSDELLVVTPPRRGLTDEQALIFAVPSDAPGLRFVTRESLALPDRGSGPLSARFDEVDAFAVFEDVRVPTGRVFLSGSARLIGPCWRHLNTLAYFHLLIRLAVKVELYLGTAALVCEAIGTNSLSAVQDQLAELARIAHTLGSFSVAAEAGARVTESGVWLPCQRTLSVGHMYAVEQYGRVVEILMKLCGAGVLMTPRQASPELGLPSLVPGAVGAEELRRQLFRMAWELTASSFAGRERLFEMFNGRDVYRNRTEFFRRLDLEPARRMALSLLSNTDAD
ncbi:MAG: hypothetical protein H6741_19055 [Alphaproteobacteria bacterium]|nr:hypothetical protein [Alphaproteobacteria bacterium]MCB9794810.1 hypothetical protein [Alphaproteobacteria bacterium]